VSADEVPNPDRVATRRFNDPRVAAKRGNPGLWDSTASPLIGARKLAKQYANSDEPMTFPRASGILLHPTSLPGRFGIGDLGDGLMPSPIFSIWRAEVVAGTAAGPNRVRRFALRVLLGFCGNTFLISPERLCAEGWVSPDDVSEIELVSDRVDFGHALQIQEKILRIAYANINTRQAPNLSTSSKSFANKIILAGRLRFVFAPSRLNTITRPGMNGSRTWCVVKSSPWTSP
jgi:hypothetical protein